MKNLLMVLVAFITVASSANASLSFQSGQFYQNQSHIENRCFDAFWDGRGSCLQECRVAQWYQECGGGYVNVQVCNRYRCWWDTRYNNGCRWAYRWRTDLIHVNRRMCW